MHIPIFFIFIVSNTAGLLTPLGDPPLFLGFLRGVPFFWTLRLLPQWMLTASVLLTIFYFVDRRALRREAPAEVARDLGSLEPLALAGRINILYLLGIVAIVLASPGLPDGPAADLGPIVAMTLVAILSLASTPRALREENRFGFGPIVEVAVLFAGIFVTIVPALQLLRGHGGRLGLTEPWQYFWLTGILSAFLDNAPTYLAFGTIAAGPNDFAWLAEHRPAILRAISCGAVFMGAMTYVGNGPNFMVKAIAEESGLRPPSFFGYLGYAWLILLPVFVLVTMLFFLPD